MVGKARWLVDAGQQRQPTTTLVIPDQTYMDNETSI